MKQSIETLRTELEERLRFETFLAETSSLFVNIPSDRLDNEIEDTQRRICEFLNLDRSTLWQLTEQGSEALLLTHLYQPPGSAPPPRTMDAKEYFPWTAQKTLAGETLPIAKMSDLPLEADRDREIWSQFGTKSTVIIPLSVGGGPVFGMLAFASMRDERDWSETVVKGFRLIAQVFSNALARKRADEQLKRHVGEIEELKQRLKRENIYLRDEVKLLVEHTNIVGQSVAMKRVLTAGAGGMWEPPDAPRGLLCRSLRRWGPQHDSLWAKHSNLDRPP